MKRYINTIFLLAIIIILTMNEKYDRTRHTATIQAIDSLRCDFTQKNKETAKSDTLKIRLKKELLVLLNDINEVQ